MKRLLICVLAACLVLSACLPVLADNVIVSLEEVFRGRNIEMANGNAFMTVKYDKWVLMDINGQEVNGDLYESLYINPNKNGSWFMVAENGKKGMLWEDGRLILPCRYDDLVCYSDKWAAGKDDSADICDICYDGTIVASVSGSMIKDFRYPEVCGNYLYFSGTSGSLSTVSIDKNGNILQTDYPSYDEYYDDYTNDGHYHVGSGQYAFTESCTLNADEVDCAYLGNKKYILDLQGNIIAKLPEEVVFPGVRDVWFRDYAIVEKDGKKGLVDNRGNIILEPVYDEVAKAAPNCLGLFLVKKDYQIMYVDSNGTIVQSINYAGSTHDIGGWIYNSPILVFENMGSKIIFTAAAGPLPQAFIGNYTIFPDSCPFVSITWKSGSGYQYGLMDVYGNMLIPFGAERIEINEQGTLVKCDDVLYKVVIENAD